MDKYKRAAKPRPQEPIKENEIRITAQGHIRNYISYATSLVQEKRTNEIVLKAMGQAISKTVAITEIIKKRIPGLYQETSINSTSITDVWEPIEEGLIPLEIARQVSLITVTLSTTELNKSSPGYQAPSNLEQPILVQQLPRQQQPQQRQQQPQQRQQQQSQQRQQQPQQRQQQPQQRQQQQQQQQQQQPRQLQQQQNPRQQQQRPRQLHPQQQQWQLSEQARVPATDANQDSYGGRIQGRGRGRGRGRGWGRGGYGNYQENDGYNNWGRGGGRGGSWGYRGGGYERGGGGGGRGYGRGRGRMRGQGRVGGYQAEF